jgi:hypothetical protein
MLEVLPWPDAGGSAVRLPPYRWDLPLFRMKDDRPGQTMMVYLASSEPGDRR